MNPVLIFGAVWFAGMACAWAFVHGALKLRRQEAAARQEEAQ